MRMLKRIGHLEHAHEQRVRGARLYAEFMEKRAEEEKDDRRLNQLYRMVDSDPHVVMPMLGRMLELADKGAGLAQEGRFLSGAECDEGNRLAAELTRHIRAGDAAVNLPTEGIGIRFGFASCATPS